MSVLPNLSEFRPLVLATAFLAHGAMHYPVVHAQSVESVGNAAGIATTRQTDLAATTWSRFGLEFDLASDSSLSIAQVAPDSAPAKAGLQPRDRLIAIDRFAFVYPQQIFAYLGGRAGQVVNFTFQRGDQTHAAQFTVAAPQTELAWLGVRLAGDAPKRTGARITHVRPGSPAAQSGLAANDVVLSLQGIEIVGAPSLILALEEQKPGSEVELNVLRGDARLTIKTKLGTRPHVASQPAALAAILNDPRTIHYGWR
jgi:S1-C subfamily serine protease